jgi:hypothetical protein
MATITRATPAQRDEYEGLYPLFGFIDVAGTRCEIERVTGPRGDPTHEVLAPHGHHFTGEGDGCHSMLCHGVADVRERAAASGIERCGSECGCDDSEVANA